jgi:hypothetical protein
MMTARDIINMIVDSTFSSDLVDMKGPFTTTYWNNSKKDNVVQQQVTVTIDGKTYEILVREK